MPSLPFPSALSRCLLRLREAARGRLSARAAVAATFGLIVTTAQAGPNIPSYDLGSLLPKSHLSPLLSKLVFQNSNAVTEDDEEAPGAGLFDRPPPLLVPDLTRFDDMVGHHIRWHYNENWSSSFGSDFPKIRTPTYELGNGAPGVTQKIWFQFSISRSF